MALPKDSAFSKIGQVLLIDRETGNEWKKLQIEFCENNGIDWYGNAYIISFDYLEYQIKELETGLARQGVDLYEHSTTGEGFLTSCFGFNNYPTPRIKCSGMEEYTLEICASIMDELGIYWCGWPEGPSFTLFASEEQIWELSERLKEPIARWQRENGYHPRK